MIIDWDTGLILTGYCTYCGGPVWDGVPGVRDSQKRLFCHKGCMRLWAEEEEDILRANWERWWAKNINPKVAMS